MRVATYFVDGRGPVAPAVRTTTHNDPLKLASGSSGARVMESRTVATSDMWAAALAWRVSQW